MVILLETKLNFVDRWMGKSLWSARHIGWTVRMSQEHGEDLNHVEMWNEPTLLIFEVPKCLYTLITQITLVDSYNFWITGIYAHVEVKKDLSSCRDYRTYLAFTQRIGFGW